MDTQWCSWYPDDEIISMLRVHIAHPYFDVDAEMQQAVKEIMAYLKGKRDELDSWIAVGQSALDELGTKEVE